MKNLLHRRKFMGAISVLISFCVLWSIYGNILIQPNQFMLSDEGEAMRSYYVMDVNLSHSNSFTEVEGLNYPFNEHIVFTDGQPATTWIGKGLSTVIPSIKNQAVGYLNCWSLYTLIVSVLLIYLILVELKVDPPYAVIFALGIILLAPQAIRMKWQPALAMSCYIPLSFYLLLHFWKSTRKKWQVLLLINSCFWFFIHPYLGLMLTCFLIVSFFVHRLIIREKLSYLELIKLSLQIILPPLIFWSFLYFTDHHIDRVSTPGGIVQFSAYLDCIFTSINSPFTQFYLNILNQTEVARLQFMESWAYIGLPATLFLIIYFIHSLLKKRNKEPSKETLLPNSIRIIFISSIIVLICALALPFKWFPSTESWLDFFPPLRQFRALGRFSWFFVFAINISMAVYLQRWIKKSTNYRKGFISLTLLVGSILIWEGTHIQSFAASSADTPNRFTTSALDPTMIAQAKIHTKNHPHQAIVPIPYFHIGSHAFQVKSAPSNAFICDVLDFSNQLELPITGSFYSRNSIPETILSFRFFSDPMFSKEIQSYFTPEPFILYHDKRRNISVEEKRILQAADKIFENDTLLVASFDYKTTLTRNSNGYLSSLRLGTKSYRKKGNRYINKGAWLDGQKTETTEFLDKRYTYVSDLRNPIFDQSKSCLREQHGESYVSFWLKHHNQKTNSLLTVHYQDRDTLDNHSETELIHALKSYNIFEEWTLCEFPLTLDSTKQIMLYFKPSKTEQHEKIEISNFMIRSSNSSIFDSISPNKWLWNNHPLWYEEE